MIEGKIAGKPVHSELRPPNAETGRSATALAHVAASPVAAVRWAEGSPEGGLPDPLAAAEVVHGLVEKARALGIDPFYSDDFDEFARQRLALRGGIPSPMFARGVGRMPA